jgi:cytidine deaminase
VIAVSKDQIDILIRRAKEVSATAYVPYSKFPVGASLLSASGKTYSACNVENASYGLSICAERSAIFKMVSESDREIVAIAIYSPTENPSAPCGACRQVISEFGFNAIVISACDSAFVLTKEIDELLPDAFGPENLNKSKGYEQ